MNVVTRLSMILLLIISVSCSSGTKNVIYVATDGNDSASGSIDTPLATLTAARDHIRKMKAAGNLPDGGVTISVRGGEYVLDKPLVIGAEDAGTAETPIVYRGYPGEKVVLLGGRVVKDFRPVTDPAIKKRLSDKAAPQVRMVDLRASGITGYENINPKDGSTMDLFYNQEFMTMAQYPDTGSWLTVKEVPIDRNNLIVGDPRSRDADGNTWGQHSARLLYDDKRPQSWDPSAADNLILHGYWYWDWSDGFQEISGIDTGKGILYIKEPFHFYGYRAGQRFYFRNVLEALDSPGEWYIDRVNGVLYFWPPTPLEEGRAIVSVLEKPIVQLDSTAFVTVRNFQFEGARGTAFMINAGSNNLIAACDIINTGGTAVVIQGGTRNGVAGCNISQVATGCISLNGGERKSLTPGENYADNNDLHHFNRVNRIGPAVNLHGVGNMLSHNKIHDAPHAAVYFYGNENILEYNEVYNVALETGDVGGFYMGRDWTCRGNIIRYNYFHHIHGPGHGGARPVYLDDWASATTIEGNIFYDTTMAAFIGGGRDNRVENNVFVKCLPSIQIDARGLSWAAYYFDRSHPNHQSTLFDRMDAMNYSKPPFSEKYPKLVTLYDDDPAIPKYNVVSRNISFESQFIMLNDGLDFDTVTVRDNLIADKVIVDRRFRDAEPKVSTAEDTEMVARLTGLGNRVIDGNPGFVDAANGDFRLREDSPAWELGFKAIPVDRIGLYVDEFRTVLPQNK